MLHIPPSSSIRQVRGEKVGHISRDNARPLAALLDAKKITIDALVPHEGDNWSLPLEMTIYAREADRAHVVRKLESAGLMFGGGEPAPYYGGGAGAGRGGYGGGYGGTQGALPRWDTWKTSALRYLSKNSLLPCISVPILTISNRVLYFTHISHSYHGSRICIRTPPKGVHAAARIDVESRLKNVFQEIDVQHMCVGGVGAYEVRAFEYKRSIGCFYLCI